MPPLQKLLKKIQTGNKVFAKLPINIYVENRHLRKSKTMKFTNNFNFKKRINYFKTNPN